MYVLKTFSIVILFLIDCFTLSSSNNKWTYFGKSEFDRWKMPWLCL